MTLALGPHRLDVIETGSYLPDAGAMFGVIPRVDWAPLLPSDANHRLPLVTRTLVVRTAGRVVVVGTGTGSWWEEDERTALGLSPASRLLPGLAALGLRATDVTDVVATHLGYEHAGGLVTKAGTTHELTFPRATVHVQRRHWRWATQPSDRDASRYRAEILETLGRSGRLHFVEGATELYPRLHLVPSEGHTVGLQLVRVEGDDCALVFCSALVPTTNHLEPCWHPAHALYPLTVLEEKKMLIAETLEERAILVFEHDARIAACRLGEKNGRPVVGEKVEFS